MAQRLAEVLPINQFPANQGQSPDKSDNRRCSGLVPTPPVTALIGTGLLGEKGSLLAHRDDAPRTLARAFPPRQ
jgi:hypothetical protein